MKVQIFTILDAKVGAFAQPWFSQTRESGMRAFLEAARDPDTMLAKHPHDFALYVVGMFDDETGVITPQLPESLGTAAGLVQLPAA